MLKLFKFAIMILGAISLWITIDTIFEYQEGLFDISRIEMLFMIALALSAFELCSTYSRIGYSWFLGIPRLFFLTGICALIPLLITLWVLWLNQPEQHTADTDGSLFQFLWFSCVFIAIQIGKPSKQQNTLKNQKTQD